MKLLVLFMLAAFCCHAQTTPVVKPRINTEKPAPATVKVSNANDCKTISGSEIAALMMAGEFSSVSVRLDRDNGFFRIGSDKRGFKIAEKKITKPGHNWVYHVNDINSTGHAIVFEENAFWLRLDFEGEEHEIKGRCPGCADRFEDRRAPDLNWVGARQIFVKLKPIIHNGSISFQADKVNMVGKFEFNGPSDILMPLLNSFELAIKKEMEKQVKTYLNSTAVKLRISKTLKPIIDKIGIEAANKVYTTDGQVFVCGRMKS